LNEKDELPELSLEDAKKLFLKYANNGDMEKAAKVAMYYSLSKPGFEERMNKAFEKALLQFRNKGDKDERET